MGHKFTMREFKEHCYACGQDVRLKYPLLRKAPAVLVGERLIGKKRRYVKLCSMCWFQQSVEGCTKEELAALCLFLMKMQTDEKTRHRKPFFDKVKFSVYLKSIVENEEDPFELEMEVKGESV